MSVRLLYGNIEVDAPLPSGNVTNVSVVGDDVVVTLNGVAQSFPASKVYNFTYKGSVGGGDLVENNTKLVEAAYLFGDHNTVTVGSYFNYVYLHGNHNAVNTAPGSFTDVLEYGSDTTINNPTGAKVQVVNLA